MKTLQYWLLACMVWSALPPSAFAADWLLYSQQGDVRVEYRKTTTQLTEIHSTTKVRSGIGAFMHLLEDTAHISDWVNYAERAELLAQPDPHSHIVHAYFSAVWPVSKRDMVTHSVWQQDPTSLVLTIQVTDAGQDYPASPGYVRMQQVSGQWRIQPLAEGWVEISYSGTADAGGRLPQFIASKVALKSSLKTFSQLAAVLPGYQQPYAGVVEPNL